LPCAWAEQCSRGFSSTGCGSVDSLLQGGSSEAKQRNQRFILDYFEEIEEFTALKGAHEQVDYPIKSS